MIEQIELLYIKIIPLYLFLILGYIAGKFLYIPKDAFSKVVFLIFSPIVIFDAISHVNISAQILSLMLLTFVIAIVMSTVTYKTTFWLFTEDHGGIRNMLAFSSGTSAVGLFGLPVVMTVIQS